jgi:hypothetical protein
MINDVRLLLESMTVVIPPPAEVLAAAPLVRDWYWVRAGSCSMVVVGVVSGSAKMADGDTIRTSPVVEVGTDRSWIRTRNSLYRLALRN